MAPGIPNRDKYRSDQISALADKLNELIEKFNFLVEDHEHIYKHYRRLQVEEIDKIDIHNLE